MISLIGINEPNCQREHTYKHVCPMKIQTSLCIYIVSESSLGIFWIAKDVKFHVDNKDSDQTLQISRLSLLWAHMSEGMFSHIEA